MSIIPHACTAGFGRLLPLAALLPLSTYSVEKLSGFEGFPS
jgi:hypothetical protein